jgi:histidinol-phosphate aminotransferase
MTTFLPPAPDYVRAIAPYQAGKPIDELAREFNLDPAKIVKLASNENPLGLPESAKRAMQAAIADLARYPDANGFELKAALAKKYAVPMEWITLGNGSNDILELAAHTFLHAGSSAIYAQYSFIVYALATQGVGARAIVVKAADYGHDLTAMLAAIEPSTNLIFIANPNNPTGTFLNGAALYAFLQKVPSRVMVVLDEAYTEYLSADSQYDSVAWTREFPNLIVSRTLSKAYGLAGLRVGFAIAQPAATDLMNRLRQPFNVNSLAQAAAIAALADAEFLSKSAELNRTELAKMCAAFKAMGLSYVPSYGNFVLVKISDDAAQTANVNLELMKRGVIVRPVAGYGLPQFLRISIGLPAENATFLAALKDILKA